MLRKPLISIIFIGFVLCQCSATPHKRSAGQVLDDNVIHVKLDTKYMKDKVVEAKDVKIKVWKGVVTLTGQVNSQKQIDRTIEVAEQQPGVTEVKAYLTLKNTPDKNYKAVSETKRAQRRTVVEEDILETRSKKAEQKEIKSDDSEFQF